MRLFGRGGGPVAAADAVAGLHGFTDVRQIATGASSEVFRARQPDFDRTVAIKVFTVTLSDRRTRERFTSELALTGRLDGLDGVTVVYDRGITPTNHPFLVMRWYDGGSLADAIEAEGPLEIDRVLRIATSLATSLAGAHGRGVIHRDVKPANVLLTDQDAPVLADFGISMLTTATTAATRALTPVHAAPELLNGDRADERSDVWSLGSTIYTALAARPPFAAPADEDGLLPMLLRLASAPLPPFVRQDVPPELWAVLERSMAKQPADRFPSAAAMADALRAVQHGTVVPVADRPPASEPLATLPVTTLPTVAPPDETWPGSPVPGVSPVPEEATITGAGAAELARRAAADASPRAGRGRRIALVAGGLLVLAAAATVVVGAVTGGHHKAAATPSPRGGPPSSSATAVPAGVSPPTAVQVSAVTPTSITLTWTDANGGRLQYVVLGGPRAQVAQGPTSATVSGLSSKTAYCLRVAAVYSVGGGLAAATPVCSTTP